MKSDNQIDSIDYKKFVDDCLDVEKDCFSFNSNLLKEAYLIGQLKARDKRIADLEYKIEQELNSIA